jgi:hypothetical protein
MGDTWSRRPGRFPNGLQVDAGSTFGGAVSITGNLTVAADTIIPTQSLTGSSVAQTLSDHGVSFITIATSNKTNDFILPAPPAAGAVKYVYVHFATTSGDEFALHCNGAAGSSANTFFGTTANTVTGNAIAAGTIPTGGSPGLVLVGASTAKWAVGMLGSTVLFNFTASTGSTAQS